MSILGLVLLTSFWLFIMHYYFKFHNLEFHFVHTEASIDYSLYMFELQHYSCNCT